MSDENQITKLSIANLSEDQFGPNKEILDQLLERFKSRGQRATVVLLSPFGPESKIVLSDVKVLFDAQDSSKTKSVSFKADPHPCGYPKEFLFTVVEIKSQGKIVSDNRTIGDWVIYASEVTGEIEIEFIVNDARYVLTPTEIKLGLGPEIRTVYLMLEVPLSSCLNEAIAADIAIPVAARQEEPLVKSKNSKSNKSNLDPVTIIVGYTTEVTQSEARIKEMLKACERDIATSLDNSLVNEGRSESQKVRFKILPDIVKTEASSNDLTIEQSVAELKKPEGRFKKLHENRGSAHLVFLLNSGFQQGFHSEEFAVFSIEQLRNGILSHELGHILCAKGGAGLSLSDHHALRSIGQSVGTTTCGWVSIMGNSKFRLNFWSADQLVGNHSNVYSTGGNAAQHIIPAVENILGIS